MLSRQVQEITPALPVYWEEQNAVRTESIPELLELIRPNLGYAAVKRVFDVIGSLALLIAAAPVMIFIALIIRCSSRGPAIFVQKRLTEGGRVFKMFKFRSMVCNAEASCGAVWAGSKDPRVTRLGRILRRTRLDELPQLFNVLRGDMSLIGPRPERPELAIDLAKRFPGFGKRLEVKAGITGLAQVKSGYASCVDTYREKLAWDILYVRKRSLLLDLKITALTVIVVMTGFGSR